VKQLNPDHLEELRVLVNKGPYFQLLNMDVQELRLGYCRMEVDLELKHLNCFGGVHGGVYASLIDTAAYWCTYCDIDENAGLTSLDLKVDNLAASVEGHLTVIGRRLKAGRSICLAEASITDAQGKPLAHGTSKTMVTHGGQTVAQVLNTTGGTDLPPKFLHA
jgi:uncharacterized protein (TIGR00369 family)